MKKVIEIEKVSFAYIRGLLILEDINLSVEERDFLGIVGPNGGGKSTLIKIILGLLNPDKGKVKVLGKEAVSARTDVGYVPQFKSFNRDFPISVEHTVLMGRLGKTHLFGGYTEGDRKIVLNILKKLGIEALRKRPIGFLSGGELQKVLLARALVTNPKILLLDEAVAGADPHAEEDILELLKEINKQVTILLVSHDIGFISKYITRVVCVNRKLVCHETVEITQEIIKDLYRSPVKLIRHKEKK